ncbi:hypothetical protein [uncultured Nostoc sp.]|uniref:hypothetical protein n=1 Tax=uncultured Nostoc sp. TaxID=340711 RepID=UPI0035C9B118
MVREYSPQRHLPPLESGGLHALDHKDAINRRQDNNQSFVLTAIYRVSCLNRTVLRRRRTNPFKQRRLH